MIIKRSMGINIMVVDKKNLLILAMFLPIMFGGCVSGGYIPPNIQAEKGRNTITVDKSYDETWQSFIEYASSTFFEIENFEKASGLLTLSFGATDASEYIDCGTFKKTAPKYNGPYARFLEKYNNAKLQGKMNIFIKKIDQHKTLVKVNARYIFTASLATQPITILTWSFDSGSSQTVVLNPSYAVPGSVNTRTCKPTYKAEKSIMQAVKSL